MSIATYKNIHTGEVFQLEKAEFVSNPPILVYVFTNGDRWNQDELQKHFVKMPTLQTPSCDDAGRTVAEM